ncbi:MAG: GNAT family N-acetyltransferase [Anaerolineae bacterium]|jgi:ribosomal protein S18 acetylase RimI-like enzyme
MANVVLRQAGKYDFESLCEIMAEVDGLHHDRLPRRFRAPEDPARSREFLLNLIDDPAQGLVVAEVSGSLVGFVHVVLRETPDIPIVVPRRYAAVENLGVKRGFQRSGIGRRLMREAHEWASAKGARSVELTVYAFNDSAMAFYRQLGYATLSHRLVKQLE